MSSDSGPDFFIVGAPKCGTTSLNAYLSAHPAIFMAKKEQHYFGSDLGDVWPKPSAERYFASFSGGQSASLQGEASGWYLRSERAAEEIYAYNPRARIIAILRNPIEMLPSYHSQCLWDRFEDIEDFEEALAAEGDRRKGLRLPARNRSDPWRLLYHDVVRFHEQIERYYLVFGREQVHVLLFEELVRQPGAAYRRVLEFLGVDPTFRPTFTVMNPNKQTRSRVVRRVVDGLRNPSSGVRRIGTRLIPVHAVRSAMLRNVVPAVMHMNTRVGARPPIDPQLRLRLVAELAPDIDQLGTVLRRDLSRWYAPDGSYSDAVSA